MTTRTVRKTRSADPRRAKTDPRAAAKQEQVKKDTARLKASARRTSTPETGGAKRARATDPKQAATEPRAAATQERVKRDTAQLKASARRVAASAAVTEDPEAARKTDRARSNADAARKSAARNGKPRRSTR